MDPTEGTRIHAVPADLPPCLEDGAPSGYELPEDPMPLEDRPPPAEEWEGGCEPPPAAGPGSGREERADRASPWEGLEANAPLMTDDLEGLQLDLGRPVLSLAKLPPWQADPPPEMGHGIGYHLNDLLRGGVEPGFLCPIGAAYAGAGKTTWLTQLVDGLVLRAWAAARGELGPKEALSPVILLSELPRKLLRRRSLARFTGRPQVALRDTGHYDHERAWEAARDALRPGSAYVEARGRFLRTVTPDVAGGWGLRGEELISRLAEWIGAWKADLAEQYPGREVWPIVVVDPIQRFQDPTKNAVEALDELCLALASTTRREGWICFATSDTNKQAAAGRERSGDPRERGTAAFRGSYELMHAANVALFIDPLEVPDEVPPDFGPLDDDPDAGGYLAVGVVKNWEGSSLPNRNAWAYYRWTKHLGRFFPMCRREGEAIRAYLNELQGAAEKASKKAKEERAARRERASKARVPNRPVAGADWPEEV
jgi:hypothetical protein